MDKRLIERPTISTMLIVGMCMTASRAAAQHEVAILIPSDAIPGDLDIAGHAVAIGNDDTIVIGDPGGDAAGLDRGSAAVFRRNLITADAWGQLTTLVGDDLQEADDFGWSVDISGEFIVIGSPTHDGDFMDQGAVYVFSRNAGGPDAWGQLVKLVASNPAEGARFGESVAIDCNTIVVGAPSPLGALAGVTYIFSRNEGGSDVWGEIAKKTEAGAPAGECYGNQVDVSGDVIVVAAEDDDEGGHPNSGAVFIYGRNQGGPDSWGFVKRIVGSDLDAPPESGHHFGRALAISGDRIVVGAENADSFTGRVYVFARNHGGVENWGELPRSNSANDAMPNTDYGHRVAIFHETIVIGAPRADVIGADSGAVYFAKRNQGGADNWGQSAKRLASDGMALDSFGAAVAVGCRFAVVGSPHVASPGVAYVFDLLPCAGDLNGDDDVNAADLAALLGNWGACP